MEQQIIVAILTSGFAALFAASAWGLRCLINMDKRLERLERAFREAGLHV